MANEIGCECPCSECEDDNCEECTRETCDDPDCEDCPNQDRAAVSGDRFEAPPQRRAASFRPETVDEASRTVELVWTTGARVLRGGGWTSQFLEELDVTPKAVRMDRLNNGAPLLNAHDDTNAAKVVGVVEGAKLSAGVGTATVRFAKAEDDEQADKIFRKVRDGILRNVSVGYRTHKIEKTDEAVDGVPVYRVVDWEPYELSVVPMGADDGAGFRSAVAAPNKCVLVTRTARSARTERKRSMADTETTTTKTPTESPAVAATRAATEARIEDLRRLNAEREAAAQAAISEERKRSAEIRAIAKRSKLGETWAERLIAAGTTVDEARAAAFDQIADKGDDIDGNTGLRISAGDDERERFIRGASAWIFQSTGVRAMVEAAAKKDPESFKGVAFDPGEFRGYSAAELARLCLERNGQKTRGVDKLRMVETAFTYRGQFQTIGDFPTLLENAIGKVLLAGYAMQANTWEQFCKAEEVTDFRANGRYRAGSLPGLDVIPEHGEYKSGAVSDGAKYSISTQRYGKMFGISQETIVNDDLGALTDMATKLGQAAMRTLENSVYALLLANAGLGPSQSDTQPFFHNNRANVSTGSALSVAGIDGDRVTMRAQKDPNGLDYLDITPSVLLVPDALYAKALEINTATYNFDSTKLQQPNSVKGLFSSIVSSPRLSGTRRYVFGGAMDAIVVAFLAGRGRGPTMATQDGWRSDGTEWKVSLFAKAQMGDPKSAVTNAGV